MLEKELVDQFRLLLPDLKKWGCEVDRIITRLVSSYNYGDIQIFPKHRIKNEQSFISKALYIKNYKDPMIDVEDKIGTRIVVLTTDVVDKVSKELENYYGWEIKKTKSKQDIYEDVPDRFGYQSIHYVVYPKQEDSIAYTSNRLEELTCEIQIRSLLQHAYAEISHDNVYKGPYKSDPKILRNLAKSMALMETADDYFCNIFEQVSNPQNMEAMLLNQLVARYKQITGESTEPSYNKNLALDVLSLIEKKPVTFQEVNSFLEETPLVIDCIKHGSSFLCSQPIILLLAYYIYKHRYFLDSEWDIDSDLLNSLKRSLGYSTGSY